MKEAIIQVTAWMNTEDIRVRVRVSQVSHRKGQPGHDHPVCF